MGYQKLPRFIEYVTGGGEAVGTVDTRYWIMHDESETGL